MFKKIELWVVGLIIIFFIVLLIITSGVLRDAYLGINKTPAFLRNNLVFLSEIPKNFYKFITYGLNYNAPPKLSKHLNKKKFEQFIPNKRNALLVLPRYDHSLNRSVIEVIDLNNFKVIHTYKHDIEEMNKKIENNKDFSKFSVNHSPIRFLYEHPLILNDGSLISAGIDYVMFKIDFCSNLKWINDKERFHHSIMIDHEKNIWVGGVMNPKSKYFRNNQRFRDDSIIKIDTEGKILFNKSIAEILIENNKIDQNILDTDGDAIHLNDIEPAFSDSKYWKKGDIFLSIREKSAIIHYRPSKNEVINYIKGPFARQHDVDIISNKEISIFNNNKFFIDNKYSEVIVYNFELDQFNKLFNDQLKTENFETSTGGLSHIFKDGALLVDETEHGRIILFNNEGKKEWEFINKDKNGDIGYISWSRIIEDELFVKKFKSLVENQKCIK